MRLSDFTRPRTSRTFTWPLVVVPLIFACCITVINVQLQRKTSSFEPDHLPFLQTEVGIARINGMLDALDSSGHPSETDIQDAVASEADVQKVGHSLTPEQNAYSPKLQDALDRYHSQFLEQIEMLKRGQLMRITAFDHANTDPNANEIASLAMVGHVAILQRTEQMETVEICVSALAAFTMAIALAILFFMIDRSRARISNAIEEHLRESNSQLETLVKERTSEMHYQAFHDKLTGLANRALFWDRLGFALNKAHRTKLGTAVIFLDLDNFKVINDSLGHAAGDELLVAVADRLMQTIRPGDTVGRMGGDEFTILLEDLSSVEQAEMVADRILLYFRQPITIQGIETFVQASIGIAFTPSHECDAQQLMKNADTAMYRAKSTGKSHFVLWNESMNHEAMERLQMENDLRRAIDHDELMLHYQPLIDLKTGNLEGAEALLRWNHPQRGLIQPGRFISIAEDTGMIVPIGIWVLEQACKQAAKWRADLHLDAFTICVNLSARQLHCDDIVESVARILASAKLPPSCLVIEITESVFVVNQDAVIEKMQRFHSLGVRLALDDFGTGYSSLSRLSVFPVDTLKIDRSFVSRLGDEEESTAVVEAIIALSKSMKMDVIGEGVETERQMSVLRSLGCHMAQGFLFAHPLSADEFFRKASMSHPHAA